MLGSFSARSYCARCGRPLRGCWCDLIVSIENRVELQLLQDIAESTNAKNTAGLLHLSLANSGKHLVDAGRPIPVDLLRELLFGDEKLPLLLYPQTREPQALGLAMPASVPDLHRLLPEHLRLVVIDATWRKSRKILYLNPVLQRLPRLALENPPVSVYRVRKADHENQLSTLEASCYALQQLERGSVDYSPLLNSLETMVERLLSFRPG